MLHALLADAATAADQAGASHVKEIHETVVQNMPPGGLGVLFVLVALTLIVSLYAVWGQRRIARNQVELAELLRKHAAGHDH